MMRTANARNAAHTPVAIRIATGVVVCVVMHVGASSALAQGVSAPPASAAPVIPPPEWVRDGRPTPQATTAVASLNTAQQRGLDPARYGAASLVDRAARMDRDALAGHPWPMDSTSAFNQELTRQIKRFASDLRLGRVNPRNVSFDFVVDGKHLDVDDAVARAARAPNISTYFDSLEPPYVHYRALKSALARTLADTADPKQRQHLRQIELTMERWRWLPDNLGDRFLVVNVPAFQLYAFDLTGGNVQPSLTMPVVVGSAARHETPIFSGLMQYMVFRPYWNIPPGILRSETIPKLRRDPGSLTRSRLEIVAAGAPDAPSTTYPATAANLSRVASGALRIRQRPGPSNSLGKAKFIFPNTYNVYLHDTPAQDLFDKTRRDFSHGCIRVANPPALAQFVLQDQPRWTPAAIDSAMNTGPESQKVPLAKPVGVYVLYGTVLVEPDGAMHFYDDLYRLDASLERALAAAK